MALVVVFLSAVFAAVVVAMGAYLGHHKVNEGHVGVYYTGGRLSDTVTHPGFHFMVPFITRMAQVSTSFQTAAVRHVECGTSEGVWVTFPQLEVVYRLQPASVIDVVREYGANCDNLVRGRTRAVAMNVCSHFTLQELYIDKFDTLDEAMLEGMAVVMKKWARGVEVVSVRLPKPVIPEAIRADYQEVERIRTQFTLVSERQGNELRVEETAKSTAVIAAQASLNVERINAQRTVDAMNGTAELSRIENAMLLERERAHADATYYAAVREAASMKAMLTPQFLQTASMKAVLSNTRMYLGDRIPGTVMEEPEDMLGPPAYADAAHSTRG